jgi:hypothetical protein
MGQEEPAGPSISVYLFSKREALAKLLFPSPTLKPKYDQEQIGDSCEIMTLCRAAVGYPRTRRGQQHDVQDQPESIDLKGLSKVKPYFLDANPDIYPMRCPGTQCLFCLRER